MFNVIDDHGWLTPFSPFHTLLCFRRSYDSTKSGTLTYSDFSKTFRDPDEDLDIYSFVQTQLQPPGMEQPAQFDVNTIVIPQMKIKEMYELNKVEKKVRNPHTAHMWNYAQCFLCAYPLWCAHLSFSILIF